MLKATQNIAGKYAYDMLMLCFRIFKMKSYTMEFKSKNKSVIPNQFQIKHIFRFIRKLLKVHESRYIATFEASRSTDKLVFA